MALLEKKDRLTIISFLIIEYYVYIGLPYSVYIRVSLDTSSFSAQSGVRPGFQNCPGFVRIFKPSVPDRLKIRLLSGFSTFVPDRSIDTFLLSLLFRFSANSVP